MAVMVWKNVTSELWNSSVLVSTLVSVLVATTEPELCGVFSKFTDSSAAAPQ